MKSHAFLIVTHSQPEILDISVRRLLAPNHFIYVHVDKKNLDFFNNPLIKDLMLIPSVRFIEDRLNVDWGGSSQIMATINLIREAFNEKGISYFHLISGQDLPLKSNSEFDAFFENTNINYIDCFSGEVTNKIKKRYMLFRFPNPFNSRSYSKYAFNRYFGQRCCYLIFKWINSLFCLMQSSIIKLGVNLRPELKMKVYYGSNWWSLNYEAIAYILDYLQDNPNYVRRFNNTSCCDEIFFQTILMASKLKSSIPDATNNILSSTMRYIDRVDTVRKLPVTLDESDLERVQSSSALFMRKIDYTISYELLCRLGYVNL